MHQREIIFRIVEYRASAIPFLMVALEEADRDLAGKLHFNVRKRQLYLKTLKELATPDDRDLISKLIAEEMRYSREAGLREDVDTKSFNAVRIFPSSFFLLLKALAATKKLFFKDKPLICDFFSKHDYFLRFSDPVDGKVSVEGLIKVRDKEILLRECDLVVPGLPHWFILGNFLGVIAGDINWKWLKPALEPEDFILSERKIEEIFGDETQEDDLPQVIWIGGKSSSPATTEKIEVFPILKLTDRMGAFADLWMDYGDERRVEYHEPVKSVSSPDKQKRCVRKLAEEKQWEKDLLETDFILKHIGTSHYYCPMDKVGKSLTFLLECGWTIFDAKGRRVLKQGHADLKVDMSQQDIVARGKVAYDNFEANLTDVVGAFNRREQFVELSPTSVGLLSYDNIEREFGVLLQGEMISEGIKIKKSHWGTLAEIWERGTSQNQKLVLGEAVEKLRKRLEQVEENYQASASDYLPSESFQGILRPYQQQGVNWLGFLQEFGFHGILADDMGLGKTVQVLAFLSRNEFKGTGLIVAPTSLLFNWRKEIEKFLPNLSILVHQGASRLKKSEDLQNAAVVLTSYAILRIDQELLSRVAFDFVILDEAQAIKNPDTKGAKAAYALNAGFRLCVTGTPVENRLQDIWSLFNFLMPELLGTKDEFQKEMAAAAVDARYLQRLKRKIRPFMLRRTKKEVASDLPEKIEQVIWVEMPPVQRQIYEEFLSGIRGNLLQKVAADGIARHRIEVFESILRLRQICCHPLLVGSLIDSPEDEEGMTSGKWDILIEDLETIVEEKRKALVYSQFTSMLQLIAKEANKQGWSISYLDGSTANREEVVRKFQEDPEINIFLISLKAGGVGLNLTSADYVYLYDPWWNEAVENQAIDRAHRIGRMEPVIAKRLVTVESIEEKMMKLKAAKRSITEHLWEGELGLSSLSEDDLQYLLS